ncbi:acyltransferase family protein [Aquimarina sp. 2201CG14-23]|uniref:acyltransferase family protein n=1 Tax=Aquimarina mycalae TaxID=3040073 RepID=UPI002477F80E|nr:acyltransferase [Aquimarina sp. 2201CG14-23]MDH7446365.1 acyltransferase [Aquimarina sp. 2201CG14-23]
MRIEQLTFTRFLAAFFVVVFHYGRNVYPFNVEVLKPVLLRGNLGVSYFFVLSGFVLILAYYERGNFFGVQQFYINRIARLLPTVYLALFLYIFYETILIGNKIQLDEFVINFLFIQSWFPSLALSLNSPAWSLSVEFLFYLVFPFLLKMLYYKLSLKKIFLVITIIWVISLVILTVILNTGIYKSPPAAIHNFTFYFPLMHINAFLIGTISAVFFLKIKDSFKSKTYQVIIISFIIFLCIYFQPKAINLHNGVLAPLFGLFLILLGSCKGKITKVFKSKFLIYLGRISFAFYILQSPIWRFFNYFTKSIEMTSNERFLFFVLTLTVISFLVYEIIEKPLNIKIRMLYYKNRQNIENANT